MLENISEKEYFSENPIDFKTDSAIVTSKKKTENADHGVKGMRWGEHKEDEPENGDNSSKDESIQNSKDDKRVDFDKRVKDGLINLEKMKDDQLKHIKGSEGYVEGKSYFTISEDEIKKLAKEKFGTGIPRINRKGEWVNREVVDCGRNIGFYIGIDGSEKETSFVEIHYAKDGWHMMPTYKR